ncbi:MAG: S-layer homology domain-containing protein, partial [Oscillospiraceae bacterium]|nr:S-layer homology domain-containing protein [Oscillospiraceae bacterium]
MTITKIAAAAMAVMLAGAAVPMTAFMPVYAISGSSTSDESDVEMKAALTVAKQRVTIPEELSEFSYSTGKSYGTKVFEFTWRTPNNAEKSRNIQVSVVGDIITSYSDSDRYSYGWSGEPSLAKLTEEEILAKAEGYIKQFDPKIADSVKAEVNSLNLFGDTARVSFKRYVNGIKVEDNGGSVTINKNTGELYSFSASWWDNADFKDAKTARSEKEIREDFKKLCTLTPYYKISTNWETKKKIVRIVYEPSFTSEIDAFTGEASTIWDDMKQADGTRFYGYGTEVETGAAVEGDAEEALDYDNGGVVFTEAELKKIQQDENLLTAEQVFELLKKDKYAALTDDYEIKSYEIYSDEQDHGVMPLSADSAVNKKEEKETFFMSIHFGAKDKNYRGYKNISVQLNAETGEIINMSKYSNSTKLPKLNVENSKTVAEAAANLYSKDIMAECHPDVHNDDEVNVWTGGFETSREFRFNRFVNGIQVSGDYINVTVDSNGVVTNYYYNYTDDVKFPSADILTSDEALDKLYTQRNFDYYYTGWITKDGKVQTYLIYEMDGFYLNAKTGKLCSWNGEPLRNYTNGKDITYTDIKGIPQEQAILAMQKYGVTVTTDSEFKPNEIITKEEFNNLLSSALHGYYSDAVEYEEGEDYEAYKAEQKKPVTRTDAAVLFTKGYDNNNIAGLKGIYKTPFSDVKSSDENIGAIAIAYAKGFIPKGDGKFGGDKQITRAEAVQMIYDYLTYITK